MRFVLLVSLCCICLTGCRLSPRAEREIALLRSEILDLEDDYYALKSQRDSAIGRLRECCDEEFELPAETSIGTIEYYDSFDVQDPCIDCDNETIIYNEPTSISEQRTQSVVEPLRIEPPDASQGGSGSRLEEVLPRDENPDGASWINDKLPLRTARSSKRISAIEINRRLSRGQDIDGIPGHEGIALLLQPKNAQGAVFKQPGFLTVRIVEPKSSLAERQIGVWQFTPSEIQSFFVRDDFAEQGILLHLPWDKQRPASPRLTVYVSYTVDSNRKLESSAEIFIEPPRADYSIDDPLVAQWIENDERWEDSNAVPRNRLRNKPSQAGRRDNDVATPQWRPVR